ncbi:hypothetical protein WG66_001139 [Moniliophthora roreri]|nr:hypothetical protein WG66_001139 [Moniliophthora roreri]
MGVDRIPYQKAGANDILRVFGLSAPAKHPASDTRLGLQRRSASFYNVFLQTTAFNTPGGQTSDMKVSFVNFLEQQYIGIMMTNGCRKARKMAVLMVISRICLRASPSSDKGS